MKPHVLLAIDLFRETHLQRISHALEGWATWEKIDEAAPEPVYKEKLSRADIVMGWPHPAWLLTSKIKLFQLPSTGYDAYLGKGLGEKPGLTLCNASGVMASAIAEHCMAMMLALTRRIPLHVRDQIERKWQRSKYDSVVGRLACVVGLGSVGTEIARRCLGMGMRVVGVRRDKNKPNNLVSKVYGEGEIQKALSQADHVFVSLPGGPETVNCFTASVFEAMKQGAYFYNVSRGCVVDEKELIRRLRAGQLAGAGLDVFSEEPLPEDSPFWNLDNVIITPHAAGRFEGEAEKLCQLFLENLIRFREGSPLLNAVDLPL